VLGAVIEIPDPRAFFATLALVATVFLVTVPLVTAVAEWKGGLTSRSAVMAGLLVAQTSEFSVVLAIYGLNLGHIGDGTVAVIALVAVLSMAATPFFASPSVAQRLLQLHPLRRRIDTSTDLHGHIVVLGYGSSGQWITRPLQNAGYQFVVIDNDPAVVQQLRSQDIDVLYGDAGDEKTLEQAGVAQARFVLASLLDPADIARVIEHAHGVPVFARVFEESDAAKIEALGGHVVVNSLSTADRFMEWFDVFEEERAAAVAAAGKAGSAPSKA
jgi:CPA2 family monovalent cation:H+ antiporter-2